MTLPYNSHVDPATLFGRQAPLNSPLCVPACELGTCGSGGSCPLAGVLKREWLADLVSNNESDYDGDVGALGKRLFTFIAGSTNPDDYPGSRQPKRREVDAYLPAVFAGGESTYHGAPLPTVAVGKSRYMPTWTFSSSLISCFRVTLQLARPLQTKEPSASRCNSVVHRSRSSQPECMDAQR